MLYLRVENRTRYPDKNRFSARFGRGLERAVEVGAGLDIEVLKRYADRPGGGVKFF